MRKMSLFVLCLFLAGCASSAKSRVLEAQISGLQGVLLSKEAEVVKLQEALLEKENQLKDKDLKIEELKKRLAEFGAF